MAQVIRQPLGYKNNSVIEMLSVWPYNSFKRIDFKKSESQWIEAVLNRMQSSQIDNNYFPNPFYSQRYPVKATSLIQAIMSTAVFERRIFISNV